MQACCCKPVDHKTGDILPSNASKHHMNRMTSCVRQHLRQAILVRQKKQRKKILTHLGHRQDKIFVLPARVNLQTPLILAHSSTPAPKLGSCSAPGQSEALQGAFGAFGALCGLWAMCQETRKSALEGDWSKSLEKQRTEDVASSSGMSSIVQPACTNKLKRDRFEDPVYSCTQDNIQAVKETNIFQITSSSSVMGMRHHI